MLASAFVEINDQEQSYVIRIWCESNAIVPDLKSSVPTPSPSPLLPGSTTKKLFFTPDADLPYPPRKPQFKVSQWFTGFTLITSSPVFLEICISLSQLFVQETTYQRISIASRNTSAARVRSQQCLTHACDTHHFPHPNHLPF